MSNISSNNKRIAKNTFYLYLRMVISTVVSLYTVRVVLNVLGEQDYGIYNVIGGVVILFSFLNHAMNSATQRFLSYEIGRNDDVMLRKTFSMSINCHVILALSVLVLLETIGLWFINTQINIPESRTLAAHFVYQFSIITFVLNILRVPFTASIISFERMSFYAYMSIIEVLLNLGIVYILLLDIDIDKLILYAALKSLISAIFIILSYLYCKRQFKSCRYSFFWDSSLFKKLFSFSGWSMIGAGSTLVTQSGSNILINIFCGVTVNAAYGIASQVSSVIYQFVSNFQLAFQPQIVKLHASKQVEEQVSLVNRASKLSYFLLLVIFVPFVLKADFVLDLWLKETPSYAVEFCRWMLVYSLIDSIQAPLWMTISATGRIKGYSIWSSLLVSLNLPIAWMLLFLGCSPVSVFMVRVALNLIAAIIRTFYVNRFLRFPIKSYVTNVFCKAIPVTLLSFSIAYFLDSLFLDDIISIIIEISLIVLLTGSIIYMWGLSSSERSFVRNTINLKLLR